VSAFDDLGSAYLVTPLMETFGESVVLHPRGSASRPVTAIIDRLGPSVIDETTGAPTPAASLELKLHSTEGVSLSELQRGLDAVEFALERPGGATRRCTVLSFSDPVGGLVTLDVR